MPLRNLFLVFLCTILSVVSGIGQWTTQKLSSKRNDVCSCQVNDNLFFIAGKDITGKPTKTIDILNLTTNTWSVKQLRSAKSRPECIAIGGKIYVAGGSNNTVDSQTLEILDSLGNYIQKNTLPNGNYSAAKLAAFTKASNTSIEFLIHVSITDLIIAKY